MSSSSPEYTKRRVNYFSELTSVAAATYEPVTT